MLAQVAVEERLALAPEPEHRVQLCPRPRRDHAAQEVHVPGRHLHVDHEVGAREREEHVDLLRVEHDRVQGELAPLVVEDGHDEGQHLVPVLDRAEHIGALVPVEGRGQDAQLEVGLQVRPRPARPLAQCRDEVVEVPAQIGERPRPAEVEEDPLEAVAQAVLVRVVAAVDRRVGREVLRRDRGAHEDQLVAVVRAPQHAHEHRVEEGLGELGLRVVDEQPEVAKLHLTPVGVVHPVEVELGPQPLDVLAHTLVVEADPLLHGPLRLGPRGPLEAPLRLGARGPEEAVVLVEPLDQNGRDSLSGPVQRLLHTHEHTVGQ